MPSQTPTYNRREQSRPSRLTLARCLVGLPRERASDLAEHNANTTSFQGAPLPQPAQIAPAVVTNHVGATDPRKNSESPSFSALGSRLHNRCTTTCPRSARRRAPHRHVHLKSRQHMCSTGRNFTSSSPPRFTPSSPSRRRENPRVELKRTGKTRSLRQRGCRRVIGPASFHSRAPVSRWSSRSVESHRHRRRRHSSSLQKT